MRTKQELVSLLELGVATGADFAELFFEDNKSSVIRVVTV